MKRGFLLQFFMIAILFLMSMSSVMATHFRGSTISWEHVSGTTVEITIREAWRSLFSNTYTLGDGTNYTAASSNAVATLTDLSGDTYTVYESKFQHTYSGMGPYTIQLSSCCRIGGLANASGNSYKVSAIVDLTNPTQSESPRVSLPFVLQMTQGMNSVALAVVDGDGPVTCRMATSAESNISTIASVASGALSVSNNCTLEWDASAAAVNSKYAAQIIAEEGGIEIPFDFVVEISSNTAPICTLNGSVNNTGTIGIPFSIFVTATDPDGNDLTVNHLGLPTGATLTPMAGTTQTSPSTATFDWTPTSVGTEAVTIVFNDSSFQQCQASFSIEVTNTPPIADAGGSYLVATNASILLEGTGTDADGDILTYAWSAEDGSFDDATIEDPTYNSFSTPGIYELTMTVTDPAGASDTDTTTVVVYDPNGGYVKSAGSMHSEAGSYLVDPSLEGIIVFGFLSIYEPWAVVPTGKTKFHFEFANMHFHSTSYEWLIVNQTDTNAQFKGIGTINGVGPYHFMVWADDGFPDTFRIKIWEDDGVGGEIVVYDNGAGQSIVGYVTVHPPYLPIF